MEDRIFVCPAPRPDPWSGKTRSETPDISVRVPKGVLDEIIPALEAGQLIGAIKGVYLWGSWDACFRGTDNDTATRWFSDFRKEARMFGANVKVLGPYIYVMFSEDN